MSLAVKWSIQSQQKSMGKIYSESEPDFSNFAINQLSTFVSIFSESKSEYDSESDFNSVFINVGICFFFTLYLHSSRKTCG